MCADLDTSMASRIGRQVLLSVTIWVLVVRMLVVAAYCFAGCARRTETFVWVMVSRRRKVLCDLFRTLPEEPVCS